MTIKARNRFYLSFSIFAFALFIFSFVIFHYEHLLGIFTYPEVTVNHPYTHPLLIFKPLYTFSGIFYEIFYICIISIIVLYAFFKTQAGELGYFLLFLSSFFFDSFRFFIPLFNLTTTFSKALLFVGSFHVGAQFLAAISLMCMVLLSDEQQRQNLEMNVFIIFAICSFIANFIPLNTGVLLPTYSIAGSFVKITKFILVAVFIISVFSLFIKNYQNDISQFMTFGYLLLFAGSIIIFNCYTLAHLIFGILFLSVGSFLYLKELHYQYLWH